jgi:hypothetical protein
MKRQCRGRRPVHRRATDPVAARSLRGCGQHVVETSPLHRVHRLRKPSYARHEKIEVDFGKQARYLSLYILKQPVLDAHRPEPAGLSLGREASVIAGQIRSTGTPSRACLQIHRSAQPKRAEGSVPNGVATPCDSGNRDRTSAQSIDTSWSPGRPIRQFGNLRWNSPAPTGPCAQYFRVPLGDAG